MTWKHKVALIRIKYRSELLIFNHFSCAYGLDKDLNFNFNSVA